MFLLLSYVFLFNIVLCSVKIGFVFIVKHITLHDNGLDRVSEVCFPY